MTELGGANLIFTESEFAGPVSQVDGDVSVGSTATRIVTGDPEGLSLSLINLGLHDIYVMTDDKVSSTHGILLIAQGGLLSLTVRDDQELPARAWWGIAPDGDTTVTYIRTRRYAQQVFRP